ncbi:hypothetical protein AB9P05_10645 [Roseivirga sp. BDSF3-8]|uniref:hypothetical protein n=1 Tax=Roseivirga sp. BDSF3-8 TaxID=3241598 RepID=UPI0035319B43
MNASFSFAFFLLAGLTIITGCCKTPQSTAKDNATYQSGEAPSGLGTEEKITDPAPEGQIARGACRVTAQVEESSEDSYQLVVREVKGYGPNYAFGYLQEGDALRVVGAGKTGWTSGQYVLVEVRPVGDEKGEGSPVVVQYLKTIDLNTKEK